jgi:hypothetical protein
MLVYSFNPAEAVRSFRPRWRWTRAAPARGGAWPGRWAPTSTATWHRSTSRGCSRRCSRRAAMPSRASPVRRALIAALSLRHPGPGPIDEEAYARRMQALARRHPRDADVALLAAEALLNLHPYDWWQPAGAAALDARHRSAAAAKPCACSPGTLAPTTTGSTCRNHRRTRQRGLSQRRRLRNAYTGSGHLLHMPSHIDMRVGRYAEAMRANQRGIAADEHYLQQVDAQGSYRVGYVAHNHHFLWAAACMAGQPQVALEAAEAAWPAACGPGPRPRAGHHRALRRAALPSHACASASGTTCCAHAPARRARPLRTGAVALRSRHRCTRSCAKPALAQRELLRCSAGGRARAGCMR